MRASAAGSGHRAPSQALSALILLAFVMLLAIGFWAGAVWIGQSLIALAV
ncbi:hypothetical protein ACFODL_00210 [Phenylobacterium terrae]|uniref:Uncharacterized protein n=1 Tax=Phenylobacterium terrae TaxID=2665495 RepID=A0ABW4MXX7_9CAUL